MSKLPVSVLKEKVIFLGALVFCTLYVNHAIARQWGLSTDAFQKETVSDTLPQISEQTMRIHKIENGEDIQMSFENGQLTELKINGQNIPQEEFDNYRDKTEGIQPKSKSGYPGSFHIFENSEDGFSLFGRWCLELNRRLFAKQQLSTVTLESAGNLRRY